MIETIEDASGLEQLRGEWDELLQASDSNCLFLTWEWLSTWWKHLSGKRQLSIITVRSGGRLVGIAPLCARPRGLGQLLPVRSLGFLGTGSVGSDYLDVILRRGYEPEAIQALAPQLASGKHMIELAQVPRGSALARAVAGEMARRGWRFSEATTEICPFINLSGHSWESYLATLGPEHRQNVRRRLRNLERHGDVRFEQVRSEARRREAFRHLVALHHMRWRERGGSDAFHTPALLAFHEEMSRVALDRDWLRLFVLWLDGKPAASLYGFRYLRRFCFYQAGFDPRYTKQSLGLVCLGLSIRRAIEEGAEEYDFLHGNEAYKSLWARETRELARLQLHPPHARGLLTLRVVGLSRRARKIARRLLPHRVTQAIIRGGRIGI